MDAMYSVCTQKQVVQDAITSERRVLILSLEFGLGGRRIMLFMHGSIAA